MGHLILIFFKFWTCPKSSGRPITLQKVHYDKSLFFKIEADIKTSDCAPQFFF